MSREVDLALFRAGLELTLYAAALLWAFFVARRLRSRRFRATLGEQEPWIAECTAQQWLCRLIPAQAERYAEYGFVEIDSTLILGRRYRIHRKRRTELYERGAYCGHSCLLLCDQAFPPTDRVVAEYFLIRGDEDSYIERANIF